MRAPLVFTGLGRWALGAFATFVLSALILAVSGVPFTWGVAGLGWGLAILNALVMEIIDRKTVGLTGRRTWRGLAANLLRAFTVLGILCLALTNSCGAGFSLVLVTFFSGYFVFMIAEVARLLRSGTKGQMRHE